MLTTKLLAAVGIAGALTVGAAADASANPWRPGFRAPVVYRAPIYRAPFFAPRPVVVAPAYAPVYQTPVYQTPAYAPVYQTPVVYGAAYAPVVRPVYGVGWRHPFVRGYGRRW